VPYFELGNHSWSHPDFAVISTSQMTSEITLTQAIIQRVAGREPTLFRFPFGTTRDEAFPVIARYGLRAIQWDVVSGDPDPAVSAEAMTHEVLQQVRNGSIVIMHINGRGWHTAEALPAIIAGLKERGFTLVTVSRLLRK
jgi:peptidoglycan/xylan/chitin deacetylase (PgdA/CDA1 family)